MDEFQFMEEFRISDEFRAPKLVLIVGSTEQLVRVHQELARIRVALGLSVDEVIVAVNDLAQASASFPREQFAEGIREAARQLQLAAEDVHLYERDFTDTNHKTARNRVICKPQYCTPRKGK